jgi:hypothetical protein
VLDLVAGVMQHRAAVERHRAQVRGQQRKVRRRQCRQESIDFGGVEAPGNGACAR